MRDFVCVKSYFDVGYSHSLKREAILFKKIAVPHLDVLLSAYARVGGSEKERSFYTDIEWLIAENVVFIPENKSKQMQLLTNEEYNRFAKAESEVMDQMVDLRYRQSIPVGDVEILARAVYAAHLSTRYVTIQLREINGMDAHPVFHIPPAPGFSQIDQVTNSDVVQIALNALPVPDEATPWEQIMDFRSDPDSTGKFFALRDWMNDMARARLTPAELEAKLEWLVYDYQRHLELHRLKTNAGVLESIIVTGTEFLENVATFKWSRVAKSLFSFKQSRVALLEAELDSPGNEVAYIMKARQTFPKS